MIADRKRHNELPVQINNILAEIAKLTANHIQTRPNERTNDLSIKTPNLKTKVQKTGVVIVNSGSGLNNKTT